MFFALVPSLLMHQRKHYIYILVFTFLLTFFFCEVKEIPETRCPSQTILLSVVDSQGIYIYIHTIHRCALLRLMTHVRLNSLASSEAVHSYPFGGSLFSDQELWGTSEEVTPPGLLN